MKKIISLTLAVLMLMTCLIIPVSAIDEVSDDYNCKDHSGTSSRLLYHQRYGFDCEATTQTYCSECGAIYDTWTAVYIPCIH